MSSNWDTLKSRLDRLERPRTTFTICPAPEVRQRLRKAKANAAEAEHTLTTLDEDDEPQRPLFEERAKTAAAERTVAQKTFDKIAITLTFQALERQQLVALEKEHPAGEQEEADGAEYADTFAPALISAASVDGMPLEYARHCLDTWSAADARALYQAALSVQHTQRTDLGKG